LCILEGVRGRNSDNTLIKAKLGWAPSISIRDGLALTHKWIKEQIQAEVATGLSAAAYASSEVVVQVTDTLDGLAKK
jgi:GDP-D-mannose 3', 5'-epimerase